MTTASARVQLPVAPKTAGTSKQGNIQIVASSALKTPSPRGTQAYSDFLKRAAQDRGQSPPHTPDRLKMADLVMKGTVKGNIDFLGYTLYNSPGSSRILIKPIGNGADTTAHRTLRFDKKALKADYICTKVSNREGTYKNDEKLRDLLKQKLHPKDFAKSQQVLALDFVNRANNSIQECPLLEDFSRLPLSENDALKILFTYLDVASALRYLHAAGVMHRDVKPSNILYNPRTNRAILGDYGLVANNCNSLPGWTACTPKYMDPLVFETFEDQTKRKGYQGAETDVYMFARSLEESLHKALLPNRDYAPSFLFTSKHLEKFIKPYASGDPFNSCYCIHASKKKKETQDKKLVDVHHVYHFAPIKARKQLLTDAAKESDNQAFVDLAALVYEILETRPSHLNSAGAPQRIESRALYLRLIDIAANADKPQLLKGRPWLQEPSRKIAKRRLDFDNEKSTFKKPRPDTTGTDGKFN